MPVGLLGSDIVQPDSSYTYDVLFYGDVEDNGTLHLYIRQIGTPDTYWKRTASLSELLGQ